MKYGKSDKGYFIIVAKGDMKEKMSEQEQMSDPLSQYSTKDKGVSFSEAGFEPGEVEGKEAYIPGEESAETFSVEGTSNKMVFIVSGKDKYDGVIVDNSNKVVKKVDELAGISGKELSKHLHMALMSEYSKNGECMIKDILESMSED